MNLSKIKCVITDFDYTLYSRDNTPSGVNYVLKFLKRERIVDNVDEGYKLILEKYPHLHGWGAVFAYMKDNGLDHRKFWKYICEEIFDFTSENLVIIEPEIILELSKKYTVYLLSDSPNTYIDFYLKYAKIDKNCFKKCVSNDYLDFDGNFSKAKFMKQILDAEKLLPEEVLMVGDSEHFDIEPAQLLGIQTCHVKSLDDTRKLFKALIDQKS